jgi:hypothetical protein
MVLQNRGTTFGVHDGGVQPSEQYAKLRAGDTRSRVFNVDHDVGSINMNPGVPVRKKGYMQMGEYVIPPKPVLRQEETKAPMVKGGFVADREDVSLSLEHVRKCGSLGRNIVGGCTIKDQYHHYYDHTRSHYGNAVGTFNEVTYHKEQNLRVQDPAAYKQEKLVPPPGHAREYRVDPNTIGFVRPGKALVDQDSLLKQPHDPGRKVNWPISRFQYARTELPNNRYKFAKTATHSGLPKPFHTTPGLEGNLTGPNHAIDRPPKPILKVV